MLVQLQYLRAIAALMVVYFHSVLQLGNITDATAIPFPLFGECGVDLFFVLSGFVMWLTTAGRPVSPQEFYRRRITRIVPLYWLMTLAAALVALVVPSLLKSTRFDVPHILASLFFIPWQNPSIGDGTEIMPLVVPGWTLNYEMYFYLIFGGLLLLPERFRAFALAGVLAVVTALCHLFPEVTAARFYSNTIVFEFVAGVFLADAYLKGWLASRVLALPLVALGFAGMVVGDLLDLEDYRAIAFGIPAALAVYGAVSFDWARVPGLGWLRAIGDASYSLYLTHIFVLAGARVVFLHLPEALRSPIVFLALALGISIAVALLVYRLFERPVEGLFRKATGRSSPVIRGPRLNTP